MILPRRHIPRPSRRLPNGTRLPDPGERVTFRRHSFQGGGVRTGTVVDVPNAPDDWRFVAVAVSYDDGWTVCDLYELASGLAAVGGCDHRPSEATEVAVRNTAEMLSDPDMIGIARRTRRWHRATAEGLANPQFDELEGGRL